MDLERVVEALEHLAAEGGVAIRRLRKGAEVLGKKQLEALKAEARAKLVEGLMGLALKIAANDAEGGSQDERTG